MHSKNITISTISWARNEAEEELLTKALYQLSTLDIPFVVTDGGSPRSFVDDISQLPNATVLSAKEKGLWAQVTESLQQAAQKQPDFVLYTEPDKLDFFKQLPHILPTLTTTENTGVVVFARTAKGFSTFPAFQQMTETTINNCCAEVTGRICDHTYGPFLVHRSVLPHLLQSKEDLGWGWRPYCFGIAARMGLDIQVHENDFACPEDQREDDATERIYRMKQLEQNIRGIVHSTVAKLD
ncbi:hypothetical protein [Aridibaculum aurantiacum]|uniref:hypothetical protein n=1 Tax=Aridibaculum aurantiacum TaxID=2810307 RepID=UPI001A95FDC4|nr:hypothetical protein [Aridibaculum aurantiacum]